MRQQLTDAMNLLRSEDPQQIGEAVRLLQGTVFAFSMKVCGHREDAEDTMQEVLMRSIPQLARITDPRALAVWLYTVTRNRCWRSRRKRAHAPSEILSLDDLMPDAAELQKLLRDRADGPEQHALQEEETRLLHTAVLSLPAQYRIVLVLHDMEDLDTEQVAEILGLLPGTVRVRLHRARLAARKAMAKLLHTPEPSTAAPTRRQKRPAGKANNSASRKGAACREVFAKLSEFLDGRLQPLACEELQEHMSGCPACVAFLRDLATAIDRCRKFEVRCDAELPARLTSLLTEEYLRMVGQPA